MNFVVISDTPIALPSSEEGVWHKAILSTGEKTMMRGHKDPESEVLTAWSDDKTDLPLYLVRWWSREPINFQPLPEDDQEVSLETEVRDHMARLKNSITEDDK